MQLFFWIITKEFQATDQIVTQLQFVFIKHFMHVPLTFSNSDTGKVMLKGVETKKNYKKHPSVSKYHNVKIQLMFVISFALTNLLKWSPLIRQYKYESESILFCYLGTKWLGQYFKLCSPILLDGHNKLVYCFYLKKWIHFYFFHLLYKS